MCCFAEKISEHEVDQPSYIDSCKSLIIISKIIVYEPNNPKLKRVKESELLSKTSPGKKAKKV